VKPFPLRPKNFILWIYHVHYTANAVALLHGVKGLVDLVEWLSVGDELVDLQLALQIVIHQTRQLGTPFDASKRTPL
jgi:hypothetical protein